MAASRRQQPELPARDATPSSLPAPPGGNEDAPAARILVNLLLTLGVSLACLVAGELLLRTRAPDRYHVWVPGLETEFRANPEIMTGIQDVGHVRINDIGMRGEERPGDADTYQILTIGGSSTEGLFLDQEETWPHLLQERLRERTGRNVWVGNVGRSGHDTRHHRFQAAELLRQYPDIDAVVVLAGVNDFMLRLSRDEEYVPLQSMSAAQRDTIRMSAFSVVPLEARRGSPLARSETWQRLRSIWIGFMARFSPYFQDKSGKKLERWRDHRRSASGLRSELPDLERGLEEYVANLEVILQQAADRGVTTIVASHPTLWRPDLPEPLRDLLWMGGIGPYQAVTGQPYYTAGALAAGMDAYNRASMAVCADRGDVCIDLAASLPGDTSILYDDVHFNENGARRVAEEIARGVLDSEVLEPARQKAANGGA